MPRRAEPEAYKEAGKRKLATLLKSTELKKRYSDKGYRPPEDMERILSGDLMPSLVNQVLEHGLNVKGVDGGWLINGGAEFVWSRLHTRFNPDELKRLLKARGFTAHQAAVATEKGLLKYRKGLISFGLLPHLERVVKPEITKGMDYHKLIMAVHQFVVGEAVSELEKEDPKKRFDPDRILVKIGDKKFQERVKKKLPIRNSEAEEQLFG